MWAKTLVGASRCSNWLRIGTPPQSSDASTLDWPQDHGPAVWRGKSSLKSEDTNRIPIHEHIQVPIFYQTWPPKVQLTKHSPKKTSPQEQKNYMSSFTPYKCSPFLPSTLPFHHCCLPPLPATSRKAPIPELRHRRRRWQTSSLGGGGKGGAGEC